MSSFYWWVLQDVLCLSNCLKRNQQTLIQERVNSATGHCCCYCRLWTNTSQSDDDKIPFFDTCHYRQTNTHSDSLERWIVYVKPDRRAHTSIPFISFWTPVRFFWSNCYFQTMISQYYLPHRSIAGMEVLAQSLLNQGVLIETQNPCNTPILPIAKPDECCFVQDLQARNNIVVPRAPNVPDF